MNVFFKTVGPDSVGYKLTKESLCFGGQALTTTDIASFSGYLETPKKPELTSDFVNKALNKIQAMVEEAIDSMKVSVNKSFQIKFNFRRLRMKFRSY